MRAGFLGGSVAAGIATVAVTVASVAFPPLAAFTTLAAIGAGIWGGDKGLQAAKNQEKAQVVNNIRAILGQQLSQIRLSIIRHFKDKADECSSSLQAISQSAVEQTKSDLNRRLSEAEAVKTQTREQAKEVVLELETKSKIIKSVLVKLETLNASQEA